MTNILCFVGSKQSGKNNSALFVYGSWMCSLGLIKGGFCIKDDGLWITDLWGDNTFAGLFDPYRNNPTMKQFLAENIDSYVKLYSFADDLKQFCINVLGLRYEQCYGTNEDKNILTHLKWEDMPGITTQRQYHDEYETKEERKRRLEYHNGGQMTAREVMQYFGTDIVRKMYGPAWARSTLKKINDEQPLLAIITDGRFDDEVDEVKINGGKCIKLLRCPMQDSHKSEQIDIKDEKFDYILDNTGMTIDERNDKLVEILTPWGILPEITFKG